MSIPSIYAYPVPKLADGTFATTKTGSPETSTIANIHDKYVALFGGTPTTSTQPVVGNYTTLLNSALTQLRAILDGYSDIKLDDLPYTFSVLRSDKFYTAAQTINGQRIDGNCREGFLAYRYYLKTIVSALDRIYGYLEDSRKILAALKSETDSNIAHTLITQLEINEDFIHQEFETLWTHYRYNADTKQWDKVVDEGFVSQLESQLEDVLYQHDSRGNLIDVNGNIIRKGIDGKYHIVDTNNELTSTESAPTISLTRDSAGNILDVNGNIVKQCLNTAGKADGKYYEINSEGTELSGTQRAPSTLARDEEGYFIDSEGHRLKIDLLGYWHKLNSKNQSTPLFSTPCPYFPGGFDADGDKVVMKYCDDDGEIQDDATPVLVKSEFKSTTGSQVGFLIDVDGAPISKGEDGVYYKLKNQNTDNDPTYKEGAFDEPLQPTLPVYARKEQGATKCETKGGELWLHDKYFKAYGNGDLKKDNDGNPIEATPQIYRDKDGFVLSDSFDEENPSGKRVVKADGSVYQLDSEGKLTMQKATAGTVQLLRDVQIAYKDSTSSSGERKDKPLTVFNSITLMDSLRYIYYYYKLIFQYGANDYSVFPNDSEIGYPCLPDVQATKPTEDTKSLGALEVFYVGYLINRDGPINAVSSFFEAKTSALRNNLALQSQKISALNVYLGFINRGMDMLNASQRDEKQRIPIGTVITLTYLCGQNMYNLFEFEGEKYLVIPSVNDYTDANAINNKHYLLIKADDSGKNLLIGDDATTGSKHWGNSFFASQGPDSTGRAGDKLDGMLYKYDGLVYIADKADVDADQGKYGEKNWVTTKGYYSKSKYKNNRYYNAEEVEITDFKLPTQIECTNVVPGSVKDYTDYSPCSTEERQTTMIKSWTDAFSTKTQFINTAIDSINTDVTVDRSKIDTLDSLTSTFRSRAQDVYMNTVANVRG